MGSGSVRSTPITRSPDHLITRSPDHPWSHDHPDHSLGPHAADQPTCVWQSRGMPTLSEDLAFRGLIHQMTDPELPEAARPARAHRLRRLRPSADSLHVGNLLQLCTLRRFQDAGHRPISLAGGGTGMIGDPGASRTSASCSTSRPSRATSQRSVPSWASSSTCDGTRAAAQQRRLAGHALDARVPARRRQALHGEPDGGQGVGQDPLRAADQGISYTEFSYMLLQAYDFLRLHLDHGCDLQIGGSDQWGNITMGVELIRKVCGDEVWGLTTPLVLKADGTKYGKTESGTVWLDPERTSPFAMYQFFVNTPDEQVGELSALLHLPRPRRDPGARLPRRRSTRSAAPRQRALARAVVALVHGEAEVAKCEEASAALFGEEIAGLSEEMLLAVTEDAPTHRRRPRRAARAASPWSTLLERTGLAKSKRRGAAHHRAGRRLREQRAADRRRPDASVRPTSCTTATSCCARAGGRSTSSGPHEAPSPLRRRRLVLIAGSALDPHLVRRRGPGGIAGAPHVGLGQRDRLR